MSNHYNELHSPLSPLHLLPLHLLPLPCSLPFSSILFLCLPFLSAPLPQYKNGLFCSKVPQKVFSQHKIGLFCSKGGFFWQLATICPFICVRLGLLGASGHKMPPLFCSPLCVFLDVCHKFALFCARPRSIRGDLSQKRHAMSGYSPTSATRP